MSQSTEEQDDELLALASIYEDSFVSAEDQEEGAGAAKGAEVVKGGELAMHLDLPPNFSIVSRRTLDNGEIHEQRHVVEHLPPIFLHFVFPPTYPMECPPKFTLSCKWLNRVQLTQLCSHLDALWEENKGSVIMFTWAQFLKDDSLQILGITEELDLEAVKPIQESALGVIASTGPCQADNQGEASGMKGATGTNSDTDKVCDNTLTNGKSEEVSGLAVAGYSCQSLDARTVQDIAPKANILRLLRDYNEDMRKKVFSNKSFECKVCFMDKLGSHCLEFWPCQHVYCKECMASYFEVQIKEGNIKCLRCPEDNCDSEANPKQVQELVPEELFKKWDEMLLNSTLSSLGDIQPCPRMHCQYPVTIEEGQGTCPSCNFVFCGLCRFGWHGVEPCKLRQSAAKQALDLYVNGDEDARIQLEERFGKKYMEMLRDEFLSMNYLEENSKRCPRCCAKIEKIDGCNKMTCLRCQRNFCWLCSAMLDNARPYDHFNQSSSPCYNLLFAGIDDNDEDDENFDDWEEGQGFLFV